MSENNGMIQDSGQFVVQILDDIDEKMAGMVISQLLSCHSTDPSRPVKIIISSRGGMVSSAVSIISAMSAIKNPIEGIVSGFCMSAATLIFLSCDRRAAFENTIFMTHQLSSGAIGAYSHLVSSKEGHDKIHETMVKIYSKVLGMSRDEVLAKLLPDGKDVYMTVEEAKEFGIVKEVFAYVPAKNAEKYYPTPDPSPSPKAVKTKGRKR